MSFVSMQCMPPKIDFCLQLLLLLSWYFNAQILHAFFILTKRFVFVSCCSDNNIQATHTTKWYCVRGRIFYAHLFVFINRVKAFNSYFVQRLKAILVQFNELTSMQSNLQCSEYAMRACNKFSVNCWVLLYVCSFVVLFRFLFYICATRCAWMQFYGWLYRAVIYNVQVHAAFW